MTEPTTSPAPLDPATLTPEQATVEFATMRENPDLYDPASPGYAAATQRMNALDARRRSSPAPREESASGSKPPSAPQAAPDSAETPLEALNRRATEASALELHGPDDQAVEESAQAALRTLVVTHDIAPTELPTFLTEAAAARGRAGLDAEARRTARDDVLADQFGEHPDLWIDRAATVLAALPADLYCHIREYRMLEDAWIWVRAAERWKQTHQ